MRVTRVVLLGGMEPAKKADNAERHGKLRCKAGCPSALIHGTE